jgi:hypothetical protein
MYRTLLLAAAFLLIAFFPACKKGGTIVEPGPKKNRPVLLINGPTAVSVQKYNDTLLVPFAFTSSDSVKQINVKDIIISGADNDLGISFSSLTGTTPFTDTVRIYTNAGVQLADYFRFFKISYDSDSVNRALQVHVVPNSNCNFLFTGSYNFKALQPSSPTVFVSNITGTGANTALISNFANSAKSVQATLNCANELITIPLQPFDTGTIHGSGSWGSSGLTINYTVYTGVYYYSGIIQGTR